MPNHVALPDQQLPQQMTNILLVDDSPANLLALEAILADLGHNLVRATSGDEALRLLLDQDFAVVLLDVRMPGLDGFETAKLIRNQERSRHTPIIFLTAHDDGPTVEQAYVLGAVDYLVKPLVPAILRAKVAGFVELFEKSEQIKRQAELLRQVERRQFESRLADENARLRESEARKAAILEAALDCIITIDHEGKVINFNPAAERTFGYRCEDVIGKDLAELIIPTALRDRHHQGLARYLATGEGPILNKRMEMTALRADGTEFPVELAITPVPAEGPPVFTGFLRDITERQRLESQLRQRAEELAEADRRKDQFVMMLAHELRNPLAPILNGLHVLRLSEADRQAVEKARTMMERQVQHLSRIVDDLLEVSRVTRGTLALRPERLDLARLVRDTAEDHRPAFEQAGLNPELELPELPVWVQGDSTRLAQVLSNLLQNALKFTDRGGKVIVRVTTDEARQQAMLIVRDTGVGIEPDVLPRLFQPFTQADRSLDRSKGGLGLGLALVKGLVELHGGEVHAGSEGPGRGAEFTVRLPRQPEPPALTAMPAAPGRTAKTQRVLVVEDNQDAADSLKLLLELFGYDVAVAYSGPAGVRTAEQWHPDVVICDIGLPGMSGYEVADALRRNPATAKARMIAVTGYGSEEDHRKSQEAGFDGHLTKPADPAALQELVARSA